jgi:hypothetical protein
MPRRDGNETSGSLSSAPLPFPRARLAITGFGVLLQADRRALVCLPKAVQGAMERFGMAAGVERAEPFPTPLHLDVKLIRLHAIRRTSCVALAN